MRFTSAGFSCVIGFFLASAAPVGAQETADQVCPVMGLLAENVMKARQMNAPLSLTLERVAGASTDPKSVPIIRAVIFQAYDHPAYSTESIQQRVIAEFRNQIEIACYSDFPNLAARP